MLQYLWSISLSFLAQPGAVNKLQKLENNLSLGVRREEGKDEEQLRRGRWGA
jgi:hypothetical protein